MFFVRKGFCAKKKYVKNVLGKVSACKKIGLWNFLCAVCVYKFLCVKQMLYRIN